MKRPVLVTIIGIVAMLGGVGQVAFGGVLLGLRNDAQFLADANMTTNKVTYIAAALVVIGVLTVVFAVGLLKGSRVARDLIGVMEVLGLGAAIYTIAALDASHRASAIGNIVGTAIVLFFLFGTDKAKAFFAKP